MKDLVYVNRSKACKQTGLSYLGSVNQSAKIKKNASYNELTYVLYLAPAKLSGYEVCPMRTQECTDACLNGSGRVKMDIKGSIVNARIKKTILFFQNRNFFMQWMIDEIQFYKRKAEESGFKFSIRLNGTSDISPVSFQYNSQNILEIFSDVQFYDYTKVHKRFELLRKYTNYDLTYSYSGHNIVECLDILSKKEGRVAMVFANTLPSNYLNYEVVDGDMYDMRYVEPKGVIVGLKFKKVKNKIDLTNNKFIINVSAIQS